MRRTSATFLVVIALALPAAILADAGPRVVEPGQGANPPSDAIVLFNGTNLGEWVSELGKEPKWKVTDGTVVVNGTGSILTRREFGDVQLHIEWATPSEVVGDGQGRGNSGVYFQGRYEVQVLDSYKNPTYPDGQAGAIYKIAAPLVNASGKPGEWQTYDIVFRAPREVDGKPQAGSLTVFHNGILVQDHVPLKGEATTAAKFSGATPKGPLMLQDHGNPVRYRNIWIRPL